MCISIVLDMILNHLQKLHMNYKIGIAICYFQTHKVVYIILIDSEHCFDIGIQFSISI